MADKKMEIAVVIAAYDKMTRVVSAITNKSIDQLNKVQKAASKVSQSAFKVAQDTGTAGLAIAAPIALATKSAAMFEDKMADVGKVMNAKVGTAAFSQMSEEAKDLSVYLSKMPEEAAALMASIGQGGVGRNELKEVSMIAGEMAIAFDLSGDAAGDAFMKTKNALNATIPDVKKLMDSINHLSDNDASKASEILTFMAAGGSGVANTMKVNGAAMAGFGSSLISMGKSGAESATIMERFQKGVFKNADMRTMFNNAGGGQAGLMAILEKGAKLKGNAQFAFFNNFGEYGTSIMQMAQNLDHVKANMKLVSNEQNYLGSVTREFQNRNSTSVGQWKQVQAMLRVVAIDVGQTFLPVLVDLMQVVKPIIKDIGIWVKENKALVGTIMKGAAMVSVFLLATSGISAVVGGVATTISGLAGAFGGLMKVFKAVQFGIFVMRYAFAFTLWPAIVSATTAVWSFTAALLANPITWIVIGIAAVVASLVLLYKNWDKVKVFFIETWQKIKEGFEFVKGLFFKYHPYGIIYSNWSQIMNFFKNVWVKIKSLFVSALVGIKNLFLKYHPYGIIYNNWETIIKFITGLGGRFYNAGKNIIKSMIDGIKSMAKMPVEEISKITKQMRDYLPFSPAKKGAFMDLHKVKIVETIAKTLIPGPLTRAMGSLTQSAASTPGRASGGLSMAGAGGGNITINFSPTINGGNSEDIKKILKENMDYVIKEIQSRMATKSRTKF